MDANKDSKGIVSVVVPNSATKISPDCSMNELMDAAALPMMIAEVPKSVGPIVRIIGALIKKLGGRYLYLGRVVNVTFNTQGPLSGIGPYEHSALIRCVTYQETRKGLWRENNDHSKV